MSKPAPVRVDVKARYIADHSEPAENKFVFAYDITVRNQGDSSVQLLTRHWIITDGDGKTQEVRGEGVVGEQPVIPAGTEFSYTSGTLLATEVGTMHGSFGMQAEDGTQFEAPIAPFTLAQPGALH